MENNETSITLNSVYSPTDLINLKTGKYYTGEVNVTGNVILADFAIIKFPVKFGIVGGNFYCHNNKLITLEGAPREVGGSFSCSLNKLYSLKNAPRKVGGFFLATHNLLASLEGMPKEIGTDGGGNCELNASGLTSLEGIHKNITKITGRFNIIGNPIKSGGIGLLLIGGISEIYSDYPAFEIIGKYLGQGKKSLLLCQEELIEAGLEEYARL